MRKKLKREQRKLSRRCKLAKDSDKKLCEYCGLEIDRDYNASINILRKGLEILKEEKVS